MRHLKFNWKWIQTEWLHKSCTRQCRIVVGIAAVGLVLAVIWLNNTMIETWASKRSTNKTQILAKKIENLSMTQNMPLVTELLARGVAEFLAAHTEPPAAPDADVQQLLELVRQNYHADIVYVMNGDGDVLASTVYGDNQSLTGQNYAFRNYFKNALAGRHSMHHAVGATTDKRGMYYAHPVFAADTQQPRRVIGAVVIKMGMDKIDAVLRQTDVPALLIAPDDRVFASSRPDWLLQNLIDLPLPESVPIAILHSKNHGPAAVKDHLELPLRNRRHHLLTAPLAFGDQRGTWLLAVLAPQHTAASTLAVILIDLALLVCLFALLLWLDYRHYKKCVRRKEQDQQRLLHEIVEGSCVATFVIDRDHRVTYWNKACEILTGIASAEVIGTRDHWKGFYKSARPTMADLIVDGKSLAEGRRRYGRNFRRSPLQPTACEVERYLPDVRGGRWVRASVNPITDADGTICGAIQTIQDITLERESQTRLEQETAKLASMISGMHEGVIFANADDIVTEVNPWFLNFTGRQKKDIVGKSLGDLHEPHIQAKLDRLLAAFRRSQCPPQIIQREILDRFLELRVQPIYKTGSNDYLGVLLNVIDVTDLVRTRRKAEEACRAKSEFLANMSHEIRTPMNSIIGFCDLLMEADLPEDERDYVQTIYNSSQNLLCLINDILDYSKIEAGKLTLEIVDVDPRGVLKHIETMIRPMADQKQIEFCINGLDELPETLRIDPTRLSQCLLNLTNNAVKFTESGHVHVTAERTRLNDRPAVRFDVTDTGIGIDPDKQQAIFESFTQADNSTTRRFGGTGLGLTITRKITEIMGGRLSLRSTPGLGSTFSIVIGTDITDSTPGAAESPAQETGPRNTGSTAEAADPDLHQQLDAIVDETRRLNHLVNNTAHKPSRTTRNENDDEP